MKYFRFVCDIKTKPSEAVDTTRDSAINEVGVFCAYLSRMYEYYFPATQTDNVVSITVCLTEDAQEAEHPQSCANIKVVTNVMDIGKFTRLTPSGKSLYIIGLCQQAIMSLVSEMSWEQSLLNILTTAFWGRIAFFGSTGEKRNVLQIGN